LTKVKQKVQKDILHQHLMPADEWKDIVDSYVHDAYVEAGYIKTNGEKDRNAVGNMCLDCLKRSICHDRTEREDNSITHGDLVAKVFPDLPGPLSWASEEQPHVAEAAYWRISGNIGTMCKMDVSGLVQKKVSVTGMVLCHTHVTNDLVLAYYITDDIGCLEEDFDSHHKQKVVKVAKSYGKNIAMAASRLPQHAGELNKGYRRAMRQALQSGNVEITPALEAASPETTSGSDENADE
jgi:hypothetical protein